ncbi:NAD-glutamate dehydrogenase [Thalassospiraceae bacterium LMO-JJ14]|nr:NAD-glutamate dehydrogenase [Thalassospiraceae bacterium LMO-JJ14]
MPKSDHAGGAIASTALGAAQKTDKGKKGKLLRAFIAEYYAHVPEHDLKALSGPELVGMARAHLETGMTRKPRTANIRVYNPDSKSNKWSADHSVVEIVTDDMPFLVDSISSELTRRELPIHLVIHPVCKVRRSKTGTVLDILERGHMDVDARTESFMHFQIAQQPEKALREIAASLKSVLEDVRASVEDWRPMRERMETVIDDLAVEPRGIQLEEASEIRELLRWLHDNHFTFLGFREYKISSAGKKTRVTVDRASGLGVLRDPGTTVFEAFQSKGALPAEIAEFLGKRDLLTVTKTNQRSQVHRSVHMDAIGIKKIDKNGKVIGHRLFVGLFTSVAYNLSPRNIPLLRRRLQNIIDRAGFSRDSHDGKALLNILETYPRDELFQIKEERLFEIATGILHLQERQRVALFVREDVFKRYLSCMVFVPRDRYDTGLRQKMQEILADAFGGEPSAFFTQLGDSPLARVHLIIKLMGRKMPKYNTLELEAKIAEAARSWGDRVLDALTAREGEARAHALHARFKNAFGPSYQAQYSSDEVLFDLDKIEALACEGGIGFHLYRPDGTDAASVRFKLYNPETEIPLSDVLPVFEHMGFKVINEAGPHSVTLPDAGFSRLVIHDFGLEQRSGAAIDVDAIRDNFEDAFARVWHGDAESDGFNALVIGAGLSWRDIVVLRAYCKYLRQVGITFSQAYMEQTIARHPGFAGLLVDMFHTIFDPAQAKNKKSNPERMRKTYLEKLENVASADEDRILRRFLNLLDSTLRTNFFQMGDDGTAKSYVSFKINSREIEDMPLPRPFREIWVYSPRVEGVHLRFGFVARGGLRWSDRPEDFRTEVLGLVKAQQVKNAVIVPVGSKGGFVCKQPPADNSRDAFLSEGIACYKIFLSGLLDITDNISGPRVTQRKDVVRLDGDDPYLVVAADKGTATFSDIANGVSIDYGHWLGDAFASGGSQGYDHKKMGITAKGAWECVKRHFREIGVDTQSEDFTCIGVGDMSGDVFGNGMLLSKHIKLLAAFNHMHIFVDPDPDPAKTWVERKRLFDMGRSSWTDYNTKLISKGGAIFERNAKSLKLSPEIKALFGIDKDTVAPNELLKAILKHNADLLWFGGIGTYIKAAHESAADVGDRANDAIRINGADVRAKVIGEGANLGTTQLGRIEFAQHGGRLNTDSIDNSAGVDSSDHEVNIKILLGQVMQAGNLNQSARNKLLASMTNEVGALVLRHNYDQGQAITLIQARGLAALDNQHRLMKTLERADRLNRTVEFLPDDEVMAERAQQRHGLFRPEIAVLLSYAKLWTYDELLASDVPDDPYLFNDLVKYFPTPLREKYRGEIAKHRLRREIVATRLTNNLINRMGSSFVNEVREKTGLGVPEIARAWFIAQEIFEMPKLWAEIEALDNKVPAATQTSMMIDTHHLLEWVTLWFLRHGEKNLDIGSNCGAFADGMRTLAANLSSTLPKHYVSDLKSRAQPYIDHGAPEALALRVANLVNLYSGCDIVKLAIKRKGDVLAVAKGYFAIGTRFRMGRLRAAAELLDSESHWQQLAIAALVEEIYSHQLHLTEAVLESARKGASPQQAVDTWITSNPALVEPTEQMLGELWNVEVNDLSMIAVASRQLRTMVDGARH